MNAQEAGRLGAAKRVRIFDDMDRPHHKPWFAKAVCVGCVAAGRDVMKLVALPALACSEHGGPVEEEEG